LFTLVFFVMKNSKRVQPAIRRWLAIWGMLVLLVTPAWAQFPSTATQVFYVCNAPGSQAGVQAFADGAGGAYIVWIDKRAGTASGAGTALVTQHLDAAGVPQLPGNGLLLFQTRGREIFGMKAVPWRGGLLLAWVQGAFGAGGDTVRCQYYNTSGVAQWAAPALVAAASPPSVVAESENALNIIPNDSGATITHALRLNNGSVRFTFNRVSATGRRRWPLNYQQVDVNPLGGVSADVYHTIGDGGDGLYLVASAAGLGSPILAQHYTLQGGAWGAFTTVSAGGTSGRGSDWYLARDPANNLYVAWTDNGGDVLVSKILPGGAWGWGVPGYLAVSQTRFVQVLTDALWHDNGLWLVWNDARAAPGSGLPNLQAVARVNAAGTTTLGLDINIQSEYSVNPKLAASDNGTAMAFFASGSIAAFGAQKIPFSSNFPLYGVPVLSYAALSAAWPSTNDYVLVSQPNGSVQVFWATSGSPTSQNICAARVQNTGTLLGTERAAEALGFIAYPNPTASELKLQFPAASRPTSLRLYDGQGRLVRAFAESVIPLSVRGLPPGLYVLRATLAGHEVSRRVVVE
jgi:hypothetical protein